jgi:hypothetical protein
LKEKQLAFNFARGLINEMEKHLPTKPFSLEYSQLLQKDITASSRKEKFIPCVFILLSAILIIIVIKSIL